MRVIAGTAKRLQLKTPEGTSTRPTTDRIKETLFNMIDPWIADSAFLDLFAGSGGIGIEALSRGAARAVFVEKNPEAVKIIRQNLNSTGLAERATVLQADVYRAIDLLNGQAPFDYIFMDPPYDRLLEKGVLGKLRNTGIVDEATVIIAEASLDTDFSYLDGMGYALIKEKKYKTNQHIFVELQGD